jgi:hypothetical protein
MSDTPETTEGKPLPNEEQIIPNYATLNPKRIVVSGTRVHDQFENKYTFMPSIWVFLHEPGKEAPVGVQITLHEAYPDGEVMARMGVHWARMMFGNVSPDVSIFDYDNEDFKVAHYNITEIENMEDAIEEMEDIKRTNKYKIH